jgi:flavin reductase (DIM6/NTAB) family NADH-FMN oxidoreductase RutF
MAKKELKMRAVVAPTQTVIVSAYDPDGKADACTLAFYMVSSHMQVTGEVKRILAEESILNENGRIVLEKLQPVIYD